MMLVNTHVMDRQTHVGLDFSTVLREFALIRGLYACSSRDFTLGLIAMARSSADVRLPSDHESESLITVIRDDNNSVDVLFS